MKEIYNNQTNALFADHDLDLENLRILLWDIDGTLMRSVAHGSYKKYFAPAMEKVYGSSGNLDAMQVSGMTDTQIMWEALRHEGFTPECILRKKDDLLNVFRDEMRRFHNGGENHYVVLDGVREILSETECRPRFVNALLTGNLSVAAEIKLRSVELWRYFENSINAFGEISHDRRELAIESGRLYKQAFAYDFRPEQFIVIGDTPNDIICAKHFGAKSVAVLTGKNQSAEKLSSLNPDAVLKNLEDTKEVLNLLETV